MNVKLYQIETRLQELVRVVNKLTGFVPIVLSWEKPEFDEFSEPLSYRINVDDHSYQDPLPLETTQHSLKVGVPRILYVCNQSHNLLYNHLIKFLRRSVLLNFHLS
jgi:hypothetical protein